MADLSYTVDVKGHDDLPKLAAGIDAVATALGNGKDIAKKLAEFNQNDLMIRILSLFLSYLSKKLCFITCPLEILV